MSDHYYDAEGNEVSLDQLCKLEPEWAANRIREYEHREKLHMDRCRHDMERIVRLEQQLADIKGKHDIACSTITDLQKERERLREQLDEYSDVLRGLASYVGCGGYNSYGRIAPKVAGEKIQWGIDHLLETLETELAELKQEVARLRSELDRYRNGRP